MRRLMSRFVLATAVLGLAVGTPGGTAQAGTIVDINQVGNDVVTTGSGTINLTGLTLDVSGPSFPSIAPDTADVAVGGSGFFDFYLGAMGPTSFGPGFGRNADFGSGDFFGVGGHGAGGVSGITVPHVYVSGTPLSGTATYVNQSLGSLGLIPGTYTYTWSSDFLTVQIGPVPEPTSIVHVGIGGLMGLVYYAWRQRRAKPPA